MSKQIGLEAPTAYVRNRTEDPATPPDRFTPIPGYNNYRSGLISSFEQMKMLRDKFGIKNIVNHSIGAMKDQQGDDRFDCAYSYSSSSPVYRTRVAGPTTENVLSGGDPCEPKWAEALGINYYPFYHGGSPPTAQEWETMRNLLAEGNTLVHCTHGVDRTGAAIARWRLELDPDLTPDEAYRYTYGFGGQWRGPDAFRNAELKAWMLSGQYDPVLSLRATRERLLPALPGGGMLWVGIGGASVLLLAVAIRYRARS
jgi:hypothetical protein